MLAEEPVTRVKKTRNRVPTSCGQCRKRKLKCDRERPCSNCVKSNTEYLCKYVANEKVSNRTPKTAMNSEIIKLKLKINHLEKILKLNNIDASDYNHLFATNSSQSSPESINSDGYDPVLSLTDKFDTLVIKESKILHSGSTSIMAFINSDSQLGIIFRPYLKKHNNDYQLYMQKQKIKALEIANQPKAMQISWLISNSSIEATNCGLSQNEKHGTEPKTTPMELKAVFEIIDKVNKELPPMFVINALIDRFFKFVYPMLPYVNEEIFKEELDLVLVPAADGGCKVGITHFQNAAIISLLLVVLRYAYLTVNVQDIKEDIVNLDDNNISLMVSSGIEINGEFVVLAKRLLMSLPVNEGIFKKVSLRNIQVLLYLKLYHTYSPELHDEGNEHSLTLSLLIQMVRSQGGELDPAQFPAIYKDEREITLRRRIFYKLLILDVTSSFDYATPLIIHDDEWTMKLPTLNRSDLKKLKDHKAGIPVPQSEVEIQRLYLENTINTDFALEYEFYKLAREGLSVFQNFSGSHRKSEFLSIVSRMENFVDTRVPSFYETINGLSINEDVTPKTGSRIRKVEVRLLCLTFIQSFYYLLYLNEKDEEDSRNVFKFALKSTEISMIVFKLAYDYTKFMNQNSKHIYESKSYGKFKAFSNNLECFIFNRIQIAYQRSNIWIFSMFLRNLEDNTITVERLMKDFGNGVDSSMVLTWFNSDFSSLNPVLDNKELMVLVFSYTKNLFFLIYSMRDTYHIAWRNSTSIKLFMSTFKLEDNKSCHEYIKYGINNLDHDVDGISTLATVFSPTISDSNTGTTTSTEPLVNPTPPYDQNLFTNDNIDSLIVQADDIEMEGAQDMKNLFYDNIDNLVDDIFVENNEKYAVYQKFELFNQYDYNDNALMNNYAGDVSDFNNITPSTKQSESVPSTIAMDTSTKYTSSVDILGESPFSPATKSLVTALNFEGNNDQDDTADVIGGQQMLKDMGISPGINPQK